MSTHPSIQGVPGVFFFLKWLQCEVDHSPTFNAKDNKIRKVHKAQLYQLMTLVVKVIMVTRKSMLTLLSTVTKVTTATGEPLVTSVTKVTIVTAVTICNSKAILKLSLYIPAGSHTGGAEVQLHSFLTSILDGCEWLTLYPGHFSLRYPANRTLDRSCIVGWTFKEM